MCVGGEGEGSMFMELSYMQEVRFVRWLHWTGWVDFDYC